MGASGDVISKIVSMIDKMKLNTSNFVYAN